MRKMKQGILLAFAVLLILLGACLPMIAARVQDAAALGKICRDEMKTVQLSFRGEETGPEGNPITVAPDFAVRRAPEEIALYPFSGQELTQAADVVKAKLAEFSTEIGVLTFTVERIAYDPILTDVRIRQEIVDIPSPGWAEEDYYARRISFAVTYSAAYDHEKTFMQDTEHAVMQVTLCRENLQTPWTYMDHGVPVEEYSDRAMSAEELASLPPADGPLLAGYHVGNGEYLLYFYDENTKEARFMRWTEETPSP